MEGVQVPSLPEIQGHSKVSFWLLQSYCVPSASIHHFSGLVFVITATVVKSYTQIAEGQHRSLPELEKTKATLNCPAGEKQSLLAQPI